MVKPHILICYDYFYPGYRAGGPVQSLTNLVEALQHEFSFSVLTTAYDLMAEQPYDSVKENSWNSVILPGCGEPVNVWYASTGNPRLGVLKQIITTAQPDVIYLNGIYSYRLFLLPLFAHFLKKNHEVVVCPRGMLQQGALSVKSSKKKYYIKALQLSGFLRNASWHATTANEAIDINDFFPRNRGVVVAPNIPKVPYISVKSLEKKQGELRLIYLSLITEKKNLLLLLQAMKALPQSVSLHIYGPIKDNTYWEKCLQLIIEMPNQVVYQGDVSPAKVQETIENYHALCLLTKGENFGHALYESLSVGRPIITSHFTPWNHLEKQHAGANVDIANTHEIKTSLLHAAALNQLQFDNYCHGALNIATDYYNNLRPVAAYKSLFG